MKNTCKIWLQAFAAVLCAGQISVTVAADDNVVLELKGYTASAIAGIPVVVALSFRNEGQGDITAFDDPIDPFSNMWEWKSSAGRTYEILVRDYNFLPIPEPLPRRKLTLMPGEKKSWDATVPTPPDIGEDEEWVLTAKILSPDWVSAPKYSRKEGDNQQTVTGLALVQPDIHGVKSASAKFKLRRMQTGCVAEKLRPTLAQAAVLGFERYGAIPKLQKEGKSVLIQACAEQGDPLAQLILFSQSLLDGKGILGHWQVLEKFAPEIKCLRNHLLSLALRGGQIVENRVPTDDRKAILPLIGKDDFFAAELKESLLLGPRGRGALGGEPQTPAPQFTPEYLAAEQERRAVSADLWEAIEPWRRDLQQKLKAGAITQDEYERMLMVAQVKLTVTVQQRQREMRQKWKAGQITEQDYKQWLQKQAEELHQKWQPDISPNGATP